jgi:hypothetical protein
MKTTDISRQDLINYLDSSIEMTNKHIEWYKEFMSRDSWMYRQVEILKAIRSIVAGTADKH